MSSQRLSKRAQAMARLLDEQDDTDLDSVLPIITRRLRDHYRANLFDFCRDVMGFADMDREVHGELCTRLQDSYWGRSTVPPSGGISRHMNLLPRGTFKTSIETTGFVLWVLTQNDPEWLPEFADQEPGWNPPPSFNGKKGYNQRFLIGTEVDKYADKFLAACKEHITSNQRFIEIYGRLDKSSGKARLKWSKDGFNLSWRDDFASRDYNVATVSLDGAVNSVHTDINIFDDLFCNNQTDSPGGIQKTIDFYKRILPVAENPSILLLTGVRWHDSDLFGYLLKTEAEKWNVYIERAIRTPQEIAEGKSELFFPSRLTHEVLADKRSSMTDYEFSCNYLNNPIDQSTALFKESYFGESAWYDLPTDPKDLQAFLANKFVYTTIDPAIDDDAQACNTVVLTCAWDPFGNVWTLDMVRERGMSPGDLIDEVFRQHLRWKPMAIGIEEQVYQKALMFYVRQRSRDERVYPFVEPMKHGGRSKERRIAGLEPLAKSGRLRFRKEHFELVDEMKRYPRGDFMDAVDAFAYQLDIAKMPTARPAEDVKPKVPTTADVDQQFADHLNLLGIGFGGDDQVRESWMAY